MGDARGHKKRKKRESKGGGMIMGVRKELLDEGEEINAGTKSVIVGDIKQEKERWRVIGVYVDERIEIMAKKIKSRIDKTR